jgi:rubrerythrin
MTTLVGTQSDFIKALQELVELEYIASETYEAAINRLESKAYRDKLTDFKTEHQRHIDELSDFLRDRKEDVPNGPTGKQIMTIGKVAIANLFGDKAILDAMKDAEDDTNTAYERLNKHKEKIKECDKILKNAWEDERRHREWIQETIREL